MSLALNIRVDVSLSSFDILTNFDISTYRQRGKRIEVCARRSGECPAAQTVLMWDSNEPADGSAHSYWYEIHNKRGLCREDISEPHLGGVGAVSRNSARVDVVLFLETRQAMLFLKKSARSVNAWERYLEAVCEASVAYIWGHGSLDETCFQSSTSQDSTINNTNEGSLNNHVDLFFSEPFLNNAQAENTRQLRLHIVVVPRGVAFDGVHSLSSPVSAPPGQHGIPCATSTDGYSRGSGSVITNKDASELFTLAIMWFAKYRHIQVSESHTEAMEASLADRKYSDASDKRTSLSIKVAIGHCTTATSPDQAAHIVLGLAHTRLKSLSEAAEAQPMGSPKRFQTSDEGGLLSSQRGKSLSTLSTLKIRPDARYKCEPHDFQKLYASMLAEVGSYSDRKTIAMVAAFPTMHHLLSHLHNFILTNQKPQFPSNAFDPKLTVGTDFGNDTIMGGDLLGTSAVSFGSHSEMLDESSKDTFNQWHGVMTSIPSVYSTNYGESKGWNVLDNAIVDALMTDYRQKKKI
ncbi:unnamed protein product [Phytomonas sp. Hart1]|nr:unnamed protein product [Phytomonas sp. Hart1]|eukprot:CCW70313.1 unnamed protein product [Phytomonas sp. isolate Hart1]